MSNREKCISILDSFSEGQLVNIAAMLEAARTAIDEAADDAFCAQLHAQYEADPERGERMTEEELLPLFGDCLMSYQIVYEKPAVKFLQKQPPEIQKRLIAAIHKLPAEGDIKPMQGIPGEYRLRVGSYRVLFAIEDQVLIIRVLTIGNRGDVYKK